MPINKELFTKYYKDTVIETGSFLGNGIQAALDANIKTIYSIELSADLYNRCKFRFQNNNNVFIINGNSAETLKWVLASLKEECLFWLDAHYSSGITAGEGLESPLYQELKDINRDHIKTHTIMIDDIRCEDQEQLRKALLEINPNYKIVLEDSYQGDNLLFEKDIMVAYV